MPRPLDARHRYVAGLDGLRAVAVLAVIFYHLGVGWAPGGLLGVGVFFTLSGYLITDLLLEHRDRAGGLGLSRFWLRRARRLLPALVVMLAVVIAWVAIADRSQLGPLRGNVVASALYVSNWWLIFQHVSYFSRFGPPSPLGHLWSLAVEEQFYLVWPWLLWLGVVVVRKSHRHARSRPGLAVLTLLAAAGSALAMGVLFHPGFDPTRVYDGTDTRAFGLLMGAALAMVWPSRRLPVSRLTGRLSLELIGLVGLVGIAVLVWRTTQYSPFVYRGGMVVLSLATAMVVLAVVSPGSWLGRWLGARPLRWLGVRSYGVYLWHYPVIVLTTPAAQRGLDLPRATVQVLAIIGLAALSWRFVEEPIRQGGRSSDAAPWSLGAYRRLMARWSWVVSTGALAALAGIAVALGELLPAATATEPIAAGVVVPQGAKGPLHHLVKSSIPATPPTIEQPASTLPPGSATTSSCSSVVHLGDSTSESLVSANYLPDPSQRLDAQYARVGAINQYLEIQGATSVVETIEGEPNAAQVASQLIAQGYHGCWVIALGTNDTADVYVGSSVSLAARIQKMMSIIGDQPVMWVNVVSLLTSGPYSEANMQAWNQALMAACPTYPNMRVYNWAAVAQPSWFIADGIHYNSVGSAERASDIATALAEAFPAPGQRGYSGCEIP